MSDDLDSLDAELASKPGPRELTMAAAWRIVQRAGRAGREAVRRDDDAVAVVRTKLRGILPVNDRPASIDTWARYGVWQGALDGWLGVVTTPPADAPTQRHASVWFAGWTLGLQAMQGVRGER